MFVVRLMGPISGAAGEFSFFKGVVEGLRLPQSRCGVMRKGGISKYSI